LEVLDQRFVLNCRWQRKFQRERANRESSLSNFKGVMRRFENTIAETAPRRAGKSLRTPPECVVADAVDVEPVSALASPANREDLKFAQNIAIAIASYAVIRGFVAKNSLLIRTGKDFGRTGN
jgi:hypothetical protein